MTRKVTIALDAMGGDSGPDAIIPAALAILERQDSVNLSLVGLPETLEVARKAVSEKNSPRLRLIAAPEVVTMTDHPAEALRRKKKSSLRLAIQEVKDGSADAGASAGNTGALMAMARHVLKTLPGIDRPAIISAIPGINNPSFMLDLGANIGCTAQHLFQFALMGSVVAKDMLNIKCPSVGLLNVGEEDVKGNEGVREAGELLARSGLNYIGFVEGNDIFKDKANVIVSDGFVGNVALKTMEGVASMIGAYLREEFQRDPLRKLQGIAASPALRALRGRLDSRRYNGARLVGLNGVVIKSHGSADKFSFEAAVSMAIIEARKGVPLQIGKLVEEQSALCIRG